MRRSVSIIVGSRDTQLRPHLMRAVGCRLSEDLRRLTVLMPQRSGHEVLNDLRDNGLVAVVFSEPSTNRTLQLKGSDATVAACGPDDMKLAERYLHGFVDEIGQLGFTSNVAHSILAHEDDLLAIEFSIAFAFDQTPGPSAGQPLSAC